MKTFRFGVIGCGLMGREFASAAARWMHLTDAKARPEIVAVCDTNTELMAWFQTHVPSVRQATTDYRELLANPEVDAIYCAVPHVLHAEFYTDIIKAGKHLLGEKPFGMDLAQNRAIMAVLAEHPESIVRCSSEMPFFPGAQKVIAMAASGEMGDILEVEAGFLHSSDIDPNKPINWKRMEHVNGAYGCMGDLGMHVLHVPLRLGWRPETLHANLVKRITERPDGKGNRVPCTTWDNATISSRVRTADQDFPLVLKTWRIAPGESNTWYIRILGMKKSAFFSTKQPRQWQWMDYQGSTQSWNTEDLGYGSVFPAITGKIFEFGFADAIQQMWAAFVDELAGGTANGFPCASPAEAAAHHAVLTAALQSGLENRVVSVDYD
ncbi:MAG: Gfo/Idh/MocA family oxidoreductase [Alphaproteobacteria bacterium]|uniref:Gfo/Idh/MocA family protein n=1 Tax=Agrobacterium sp. MA01 TaxID=2664893 RepID=UPI00129A35D0|nr:Gfo/Idh/MocA family oxidoreductase [Agrobacterium sp. MA01]MBU0736983.1 Gfo/Idh/MocA family oxidoreductase [Alphaproteobacteria bacterium]MBU0835438.1 Gfo/Idh/MocA family oxidoreductase [Alphaproteobacteria bacterium]MBU1765723.1 Gfo/Idh/MocA family oxidoreductase [Alphaproteobacteria bacterium]QGG92161.1 gfo/Idh/MocA family oxidoreductase [Agrobacterium sp. MA01]